MPGTVKDIASLRLYNQQISHQTYKTPAEIVRHMGAIQAQDYASALWAIGLRLPNATLSDIEQTIVSKQIVRTWPMRGTLHFVAPEDIRWMLKLLTPKVITGAASRHRGLNLDESVFGQAADVLVQNLQGGKILTRNEAFAVLEGHGIATANQRGVHILWTLAQRGLLCYGPHKRKEPTFVLLDEWLPAEPEISREESLARLAERYFTSHGPATIEDFATWGRLSLTDARAGLQEVENKLVHEKIGDKTYWFAQPSQTRQAANSAFLLPGYDEYILGYKDRSDVLAPEHSHKVVPGGNGVFRPIIVVDGQIVGLWQRKITKKSVTIKFEPFGRLDPAYLSSLEQSAQQYGRFLGLPVTVMPDN